MITVPSEASKATGKVKTRVQGGKRKKKLANVGFEPTPFRTSALNWRLRPLGQLTTIRKPQPSGNKNRSHADHTHPTATHATRTTKRHHAQPASRHKNAPSIALVRALRHNLWPPSMSRVQTNLSSSTFPSHQNKPPRHDCTHTRCRCRPCSTSTVSTSAVILVKPMRSRLSSTNSAETSLRPRILFTHVYCSDRGQPRWVVRIRRTVLVPGQRTQRECPFDKG
jgi:hypothetical protein